MHDAQHGFRKRRSCETQLIDTIHDFATALNDGYEVDAIFLDMSKAFDTVPHIRLCQKLSFYGIRNNVLQWIESFLANRTRCVILNGCSSDACQVLSGVPQGSVLGPILFLCYINDLPNNIVSNIKLYADDALLYRVIRSTSDSNTLQLDLDSLMQWAFTW